MSPATTPPVIQLVGPDGFYNDLERQLLKKMGLPGRIDLPVFWAIALRLPLGKRSRYHRGQALSLRYSQLGNISRTHAQVGEVLGIYNVIQVGQLITDGLDLMCYPDRLEQWHVAPAAPLALVQTRMAGP